MLKHKLNQKFESGVHIDKGTSYTKTQATPLFSIITEFASMYEINPHSVLLMLRE